MDSGPLTFPGSSHPNAELLHSSDSKSAQSCNSVAMKAPALLTAATLVASTLAADLKLVKENFGPNPTNASFYLYVPDRLQPKAPLLVYPHWCHGDATSAFNSKPWRALADKLSFVTIYPSTPWTADNCWDVSSQQTLRHDAGGDSLGIASMTRWTLAHHDVDPDRVFVTGVSSGAMMTNVLLGAYPDLFAAGSAFAGVASGCFAGNGYDVWSDACATGKVVRDGAGWADMVTAMYPGYTGARPKVQLFHGTDDEVLNVQNYYEEIKLWSTVLGTGGEPTKVVEDDPERGWTKRVYGDKGLLEGFLAKGVSHNIPDQVDEVIRFFELDCKTNCFGRKTLEKIQGIVPRDSM